MSTFQNLRFFVTGGAGFIGSHTCEMLMDHGGFVTALDNFDPFYDRAEKLRNIENCLKKSNFRLIEGDIRDRDLMMSAVREARVDVVIHLAAKAGVRPSLEDPAGYADVNVRGTITVLEAAQACGVRQVVFASSSSVYGNQGGEPLSESLSTDKPLSPYGATKKAGELLCHAGHHVHGLSIACLRFFTVYGPRQRPDLAIRKFVRLALERKPIPFFGDGGSRRDYTHVRDILSGIAGAITWVAASQPRYGIFNLGSAHPVSLHELVNLIETHVGVPVTKNLLPLQPGDVFQTCADTSRAEAELGFRHQVPFEEGLRDFIHWMKRRGPSAL